MSALTEALTEYDEVEARRAELVAEFERGEISTYRYDEAIADLGEQYHGILDARVSAIRDGEVHLRVPMIPERQAGLVRLSGGGWLTPYDAEELAGNLLDSAWAARNCNR